MNYNNFYDTLQYNPMQGTLYYSQQSTTQQSTAQQKDILLQPQQSTEDINGIIDMFNHNTTLNWKPKKKFLNDIDIIVEELLHYYSYSNIDIYELLVSCGHNLTWDTEYLITLEDLNWFKDNNGKNYFFTNIITKCISNQEYNMLNEIYIILTELFELQLDN